MEKRVLLAAPHMMALARQIQAARPDNITLIELGWNAHPNGQPNLFIGGADVINQIRRSSVSLLLGFTDQANYFAQYCVLGELVKLDPRWFQILLPYDSSAASERASREGEVPNAETFAAILSALASPGPYRLVVYDLHALPVKGFYRGSLRPILRSAISVLKKYVIGNDLEDRATFVFPDDGADKRYAPYFDGTNGGKAYPTAVCVKKRLPDGSVVVTLKKGDVRGRIAIIVDDMIRSGKTNIACAEGMRAAGADQVIAFATHADFEPGAVTRFTNSKAFDQVWISDSCPEAAYAVDGVGPFKVLSIARKLANDVCRPVSVMEEVEE